MLCLGRLSLDMPFTTRVPQQRSFAAGHADPPCLHAGQSPQVGGLKRRAANIQKFLLKPGGAGTGLCCRCSTCLGGRQCEYFALIDELLLTSAALASRDWLGLMLMLSAQSAAPIAGTFQIRGACHVQLRLRLAVRAHAPACLDLAMHCRTQPVQASLKGLIGFSVHVQEEQAATCRARRRGGQGSGTTTHRPAQD